eukprot:4330371-Prymnesium_polylepis.1
MLRLGRALNRAPIARLPVTPARHVAAQSAGDDDVGSHRHPVPKGRRVARVDCPKRARARRRTVGCGGAFGGLGVVQAARGGRVCCAAARPRRTRALFGSRRSASASGTRAHSLLLAH